ncbi:hypothetical protein VTH82DRAFT_4754 [Thermothelomyces myriococcoides]
MPILPPFVILPRPVSTLSSTSFSFEQWVEDIIANPDTAASVEEAVAAAEAAEVVGRAGGLLARDDADAVDCNREPRGWKRTSAQEAAACIDELARRGGNGEVCAIGQGKLSAQFCRRGSAQIAGSKAVQSRQGVNCNDVARTAGLIFDACWRADETIVGSRIRWNNGNIQIGILGV